MYFEGFLVGVCTFLLIGLFHVIVIKGEYYFSKRIWPLFLVIGLWLLVWSLFVEDVLWSSLIAVGGISFLWSIGEIIQQEERVRKGWFPKNPKRRYPW